MMMMMMIIIIIIITNDKFTYPFDSNFSLYFIFLIHNASKYKHSSVILLHIFLLVLVKGFELGSERKAGTTQKTSRVP